MEPPRPRVDRRLPGHRLEPLSGGWSGETFLAARPGEPGDHVVVRYFADGRHAPGAPQIQAALLDRVRGLVPVPAVRQVHDADDGLPGLVVTELLPGERGDLVLARLVARTPGSERADDLRSLGHALGLVAGTLAGTPLPRTGMFADRSLRIEPFDLRLPDWVDTHAPRLVEAGWSDGEVTGLRTVAERAAVDRDGAAPCLVHSDLNPKNVLDWEFAHAGHPATDLGNLLRFDREPAYVEGVLDGWFAGSGAAPGGGPDRAAQVPERRRATDLARAADLVALIELAARAQTNPVVRRARAHLRAIARTGDVNAAP